MVWNPREELVEGAVEEAHDEGTGTRRSLLPPWTQRAAPPRKMMTTSETSEELVDEELCDRLGRALTFQPPCFAWSTPMRVEDVAVDECWRPWEMPMRPGLFDHGACGGTSAVLVPRKAGATVSDGAVEWENTSDGTHRLGHALAFQPPSPEWPLEVKAEDASVEHRRPWEVPMRPGPVEQGSRGSMSAGPAPAKVGVTVTDGAAVLSNTSHGIHRLRPWEMPKRVDLDSCGSVSAALVATKACIASSDSAAEAAGASGASAGTEP
eukprot:CAMPEP_0183587750 /NCGR_PEP_ID=MMETSP0371-20130417/159541_1 /TAXON_ID=268820 /ORGANISM="Peridinium aciculiferum, Strain PAER-2" /LENGTH=265 /DNA_ID=CAMNT_0025798957 /DNA_START=59 /DNA_END=853 /DNA_ORIENTATION=-